MKTCKDFNIPLCFDCEHYFAIFSCSMIGIIRNFEIFEANDPIKSWIEMLLWYKKAKIIGHSDIHFQTAAKYLYPELPDIHEKAKSLMILL